MRRSGLIALASALLLVASTPAQAAETLLNPFGDQATRVIQGYNGGTHQGRSRYGLDLVLAGGGTSGATVVSPIEGRVTWSFAPGAGNGCIGIALRDGSYSVTLCHVLFQQAFGRGASIARGQVLGTVGAAGTLGNNGTPHVHLELHRGAGSPDPIPFDPSVGLALEGVTVPAAPRAAVAARAASAAEAPRPAPAAAAPPPAAPAPAPAMRAVASAPAPAPAAAAPLRAAVVAGTGSCLNVRAAPATDAPVQACVADGTEVELGRESAEGWRQIGDKGWASTEYLRLTRAVVSGTDSCLKVRVEPTTSARVVGCLKEGTAVALAEGPETADGLGWFKVADAGGWVADAFLG